MLEFIIKKKTYTGVQTYGGFLHIMHLIFRILDTEYKLGVVVGILCSLPLSVHL